MSKAHLAQPCSKCTDPDACWKADECLLNKPKFEIERRFLVTSNLWELDVSSMSLIQQGYLINNSECILRVRTVTRPAHRMEAWLTVKGKQVGITKPENEVAINSASAFALMSQCPELLRKRRFEVPVDSHTWYVDEFHDQNAGLYIAEIELKSEAEHFNCPPWVGEEVTQDHRYANSNLVKNPFTTWPKKK